MATIRVLQRSAPPECLIFLPPAHFFCPPGIIPPTIGHRVQLSSQVAEAVLASGDDALLISWAKNKGAVIENLSPTATVLYVWSKLVSQSMADGYWWSPVLEAWAFYHPSLLPKAKILAAQFSSSLRAWSGCPHNWPILAFLAAEAAPAAFFDSTSPVWLAKYPRALKSYLARPLDQLDTEALWATWHKLFTQAPSGEPSIAGRLLYTWLTSHHQIPQYILDDLDPAGWLINASASKQVLAALLRTAPTVATTPADLLAEAARTTDWRVLVNCFDHPLGSPALGPIFQDKVEAGALANHLVRSPLKALVLSRHGACTKEVVSYIFTFRSFDTSAHRLLWARMPPNLALGVAESLIDPSAPADHSDDLACLIGLNRPDLGRALINSGRLKYWLTHQSRTVRLAAASLSGCAATSGAKSPL